MCLESRSSFCAAVFITAYLAGVSWVMAETIDVKYYGKLDLARFACTDVSRSSFINRACYDKSQQFMVVQLRSVYYPYCEMPAPTFEAFLTAPSMGKYYNANIKGSGSNGPFDCRTHRVPRY
ncbi:KTSC domain-containing protein [Nitrobacter sp. TKz-YC02]|uniref:KTSC domain-containing protein n=1 Tax=Nitrobacter sp. TKz-YC02 TaxID=3398704 RepID=UPI003CF40D09